MENRDENGRFIKKHTTIICSREGCNKRVRNTSGFCSRHVDWSKYAHASSILMNEDILFLSQNYQQLSDNEITKILLSKAYHKDHSEKQILNAVRHHRRKYLSHRYNGKFYYKSIKSTYASQHLLCEICKWCEDTCDVHHILQETCFIDKTDYHLENNLMSLCPNHHRVLETIRKNNILEYKKVISKYKGDINIWEKTEKRYL